MADFRPFTPEEVPAAAAPEAPAAAPAARNWGLSHLPFTFKYEGSFPDALKIKKKLNLGPLQLSLAGVWERKSKEFYSKVSVKVRYGVHDAEVTHEQCYKQVSSRLRWHPVRQPSELVQTKACKYFNPCINYSWFCYCRTGSSEANSASGQMTQL
jgi:hypothetical protein